MNILTIDFETYWAKDFSLRSKELNMSEYVLDERFSVHMMGIKVDEGPVVVYRPDEIQRVLDSYDWSKTAVLCHNTAFDGFILSQHYNIVPAFYYDTLSMARGKYSVAYPLDLDSVAQYCGFAGKMKAILQESKDVRDLPPNLYQKMAEYCAQDVDQTYKVFCAMLPDYPEAELELIDLTLRMFCDPILEVDLPRVQLALEAEVGKKVAAVMRSGVSAADLMSNQRFAQILVNHGITVPLKISPRTGKTAFALAKTDPGMQHLRRNPIATPLIEARMAIKSTINETRAGRLLKVGDAQLPVLLNYCGAHTTRWSAGNKMNLQNLPKKGELRRSILAPKGHVIIVADSSQIEARVLAWLSAHERLLNIYETAQDPYRWMASLAYNKHKDAVTDAERFLGKVLTLGLGYGMGAIKLQETLAKGALGAAPVQISTHEAERLVKVYREANKPIVSLWEQAKLLIMNMVGGKEVEFGPLFVAKETIFLPSGLALQYPDLKITADDNQVRGYTYQMRKVRTRIYGGLLVENIIQALARCIVADQMLAISKRYRVVTMTHDEVVVVTPQEQAEEAFTFMIAEMKKPPDWAPDLPLNAEGGWDTMYSK